MLDIKAIDVVTAFLHVSESDVRAERTIYKDYIEVQSKTPVPNLNVTLYNLVTGGVGFQVTVDHDKGSKIFTQRTYYFGTDVSSVYNKLEMQGDWIGAGVSIKPARLNGKEAIISLESNGNPLHIKADTY